jgi:dUTPase
MKTEEVIKIFIQKNFKPCEKNFPSDAGLDIKAISDPLIVGKTVNYGLYSYIEYIEYDTGIKIDTLQRKINKNIYALIYPRSSISNKTNLVLANSVGIIDPLYRDSIKLRFKYNFQPEDLCLMNDSKIIGKINYDKIYKIGDRIGQIIFSENLNFEINYVEQLIETGRGGFGSTGD